MKSQFIVVPPALNIPMLKIKLIALAMFSLCSQNHKQLVCLMTLSKWLTYSRAGFESLWWIIQWINSLWPLTELHITVSWNENYIIYITLIVQLWKKLRDCLKILSFSGFDFNQIQLFFYSLNYWRNLFSILNKNIVI